MTPCIACGRTDLPVDAAGWCADCRPRGATACPSCTMRAAHWHETVTRYVAHTCHDRPCDAPIVLTRAVKVYAGVRRDGTRCDGTPIETTEETP